MSWPVHNKDSCYWYQNAPSGSYSIYRLGMGRFRAWEPSRPLGLHRSWLTLILLTWRIWWARNNASKWQIGFNSAFKGLNCVHLQERTNAYAAPQSLPVPTVSLPLGTGPPYYDTGFLPSQIFRQPVPLMWASELQDLYSRTSSYVTFHRVRPSVSRDSSITLSSSLLCFRILPQSIKVPFITFPSLPCYWKSCVRWKKS